MHKPLYRNPIRNLHALGLADEDADVNAYRKGSEPALVWAADYGTPMVVKALLARGAKVDARVKGGLTALDFASQNGHEENLRLLLAAGADADFHDEDGYSPLMSACNDRDCAGESPLWKAVHRLRYDENAADTIRLLLDAGASVAEAAGAELLAWAKRHGYDETASLLTSAGARAS